MQSSIHNQNVSATSPIGVFDSGIGGLTIVEKIYELLPQEQLIYIADNKYAPYGDKSDEMIIERVNQIADYFIAQNVKAIVIACNTATVVAIDQLRKRISIPVIGVEPAIKPAALNSKSQKIAILATKATSVNKRFLNLVNQHKNGAEVFIQPCPGLVECIENGEINNSHTLALLTEYIAPLKNKNIDKLVLGCTHYPILTQQIKQVIGEDICLLDTGLPVAKRLDYILTHHNLKNSKPLTLDSDSSDVGSSNIWLSTETLTANIKQVFNNDWQTLSSLSPS